MSTHDDGHGADPDPSRIGTPTEAEGRHAAGPGTGPDEERPLGLSVLTWLYWFWTGATVIVFLSLIPGDEPVPIAGETLSRSEALARVLPVLLPMGLAALGAALALSLRRYWARPASLLPVILAAFGPALSGVGSTTADLVTGALALLPILAVLVWYLYFRPRTAEYFERLRRGPDDAE